MVHHPISNEPVSFPSAFVVLQGCPGDGMLNTMDCTLPHLSEIQASMDTNNRAGSHHCANASDGSNRENMAKIALQWRTECRDKQVQQRVECRQKQDDFHAQPSACMQSMMELARQEQWWLDSDDSGCLAVFETVPLHTSIGIVIPGARVGHLSPGTAVTGTALILVKQEGNDTDNLHNTPNTDSSTVHTITMLQLDDGRCCVYSLNDYCFLAPGSLEDYCRFQTHPRQEQHWVWRVTCLAGAFVRRGLELSAMHRITLPYGSLCRVSKRTFNSMGLSRLHVHTTTPSSSSSSVAQQHNNNNDEPVEGWISEMLNPLSGQRGWISRPLSFPVPALYKVIATHRLTIRSGIEIASPVIGWAKQGAILKVTGRVFAEHPADNCVTRFRLAGDGGWVSLLPSTSVDLDIVDAEFMGIDSQFDPDNAIEYHVREMQRVQRMMSDDDEGDGTDGEELVSYLTSPTGPPLGRYASPAATCTNTIPDESCLICLSGERTATIVHGETGHIACCLVCARILKAKGESCPVCRLPIDLVIQHFWA